jgi:hypothetical protein
MRKICPSVEGDQAAVRCWVTHRQQQENSECDINMGTEGSREKNIVSRTTPAVNNNPTSTSTIFSARFRFMVPSFYSEKSTPTIKSNGDD